MSEATWKDVKDLLKVNDLGIDESLNIESIKRVKHVLSDFELKDIVDKIHDPVHFKNFNYANLVDLQDKVSKLNETIDIAKEQIDLLEFHKRGEVFDFGRLRKIFKEQDLHKKFPKFNFDRFEELVKNPVLELENFKGEKIKYDRFVVKKILMGINQMIFSEMDLYMINVGKEGSGKSCFASQLLLYMYFIIKEVGLVEYEYDVKKLFFSSLQRMLEVQENQPNDDYFRIMCLDEAYELNRGNYREENSKEYKDDMRSSRKMLRIVILNLPQIGELETAITLTRTNFIFYSDMDSDTKLGTVKKGDINMYILPRGKKIYSPYQRRNISDAEITNSINKVMRDKNDAYKGFPKNTLIHRFRAKGIWGFDKEKYDAFIKNENKKRRLTGNIKMTDYVGYILYKKLPAIKHWGAFDLKDKKDKTMYNAVQKWLRNNISKRYITNPELVTKFELLYNSGMKQ